MASIRRILAKVMITVVMGGAACSGLAAASSESSEDGDQYVWHWSSRCESPKQIVAMLIVDNRDIHKLSIPLCRVRRTSLGSEDKKTAVSTFVLTKVTRSVFGEPSGARIEIDIWEAGSETGGIVLGLSASQSDRVLFNTLHSVSLVGAAESSLTPGVLFRTLPTLHPESSSPPKAN